MNNSKNTIARSNKYNFCHLHRHCEASIQDGVGRVEEGVRYAHEMGHPAVAITDHGNLISYVRFWNEAKQLGIKHIFGLEAYLVDDMNIKDKEHRGYNHCTILVKNDVGLKSILKINSISHRIGFYSKPRIDWDTLLKYKDGLIILSGCVVGRTCQYILGGRLNEAMSWNRMMKKELGEDYYMETMLSDFKEQVQCNKEILNISKTLDIPTVITGDAHYVRSEDYIAQKTMMLVAAKATMSQLEEQQRRKAEEGPSDQSDDRKDRIWIFESDQYWMKNEKELLEAWNKWHKDYYPFELVERHLNASGEIANKVEIVDLDDSMKVPNAGIEAKDHEQYLLDLISRGLAERGLLYKEEYFDRVEMELEIIKEKGLIDYFLVMRDVIKWAKDNDIAVGPGRGSAGGSLICYLIHITEIDPLEHDLLFERFLDLGRAEMPDIDTDFEIEERDRVKQYIAERYGSEHVANITALGTFKARNIVRDVARVYNHEPKQINIISKLIPENSTFVDDKLYDEYGGEYHNKELDTFFKDNPIVPKIASKLFGQIRHVSKHAAGVIVTDKPLDECVAVMRVGGEIMTAWTDGIYRKELSQLNVLKLDILGLKTLTILKRTCELVGMKYEDLLKVDVNDKNVYKSINEGGLIKGIFQFDSNTGSGLFERMQPDCFEDLVALAALDRPGPMDSEVAFDYVFSRIGEKPAPVYQHKIINEILGPTHGIILFQEQMMTLAKRLSGFTPIDASALRKNLVKRVLSKEAEIKIEKDRKVIKKQFIEKAIQNGVTEEEINKLWDVMLKFARYGFNKAHSVGYAYITFWTMYMKVYHDVEFYSSLLTYISIGTDDHGTDDFENTRHEMMRMGISLQGPNINVPHRKFMPDREKRRVLFGMERIKFVSEKAIEAIKSAAPFESLEDFHNRVEKRACNKRAKEALIRCGAFRDIEPDTGKLLQQLKQLHGRKKDVFEYEEYTEVQKLKDEKEYLKTELSLPPKLIKRRRNYDAKEASWMRRNLFPLPEDKLKKMELYNTEYTDPNSGVTYERYSGYLLESRVTMSKNGNMMLLVSLDVMGTGKNIMTFFVMEWEPLYKEILSLNLMKHTPVAVALIKRNSKRDYPKITHLQKL